jgi:hypothetical protein
VELSLSRAGEFHMKGANYVGYVVITKADFAVAAG